MTRLRIVVEVPDDVDPALVDPHEVAETIVEQHSAWASMNAETVVEFVSAEWEVPAPVLEPPVDHVDRP